MTRALKPPLGPHCPIPARRLRAKALTGTRHQADVCRATTSFMTAIGEPGVNLAPGGELTRNVYPASGGQVNVLYVTDDVGSVAITPNTAAGAKAFRCVTDPLN